MITFAERKLLGVLQRQRGPNIVGLWGVFQPFADGLKFILTRTTIPSFAYGGVFLFVSVFSLAVAFLPWAVIPFPSVYCDLNLGILFVLAASSAVCLLGFDMNIPQLFFVFYTPVPSTNCKEQTKADIIVISQMMCI